MADKYKKTAQDKLEAELAAKAKLQEQKKRRQAITTVIVVILCLVLIITFCFPAISWIVS